MLNNKVCLSQKEIEELLVRKGVNPTAQRIAICQFVLCDGDHPTADQIKEWVDQNFPKMSLATVYNTLNVLVEAGIIREYKFPHSDKTFYDNNLIDHFHFLDEETNQLFDIAPEFVQINKEKLKEFQVNKADVILYGRKIKEEKN